MDLQSACNAMIANSTGMIGANGVADEACRSAIGDADNACTNPDSSDPVWVQNGSILSSNGYYVNYGTANAKAAASLGDLETQRDIASASGVAMAGVGLLNASNCKKMIANMLAQNCVNGSQASNNPICVNQYCAAHPTE